MSAEVNVPTLIASSNITEKLALSVVVGSTWLAV
jgi:hypothetical protein